jgi:hypothetical protein
MILMERTPSHLFFSGLIGTMVCLFPNVLCAAPEDISETTPAAIDLEIIQDELEFLKEENVSIAAAHEQPISEVPSTILFSRQLQSKTNDNLPVARTSQDRPRDCRDPFRSCEIYKRKEYSASPIKKCSVKNVFKKREPENAVS